MIVDTKKRTGKKVVLVVDDDESMREGCRRILEEDGYRAEAAEDGAQGLRLVGRLGPSVVLVDLKMPGMDGLELLRRIREVNPDIATVVITGYGTLNSAIEAMRTGAVDFLCKPFDDEALLAAIGRGLGRNPPGRIPAKPGGVHAAPCRNAAVILEVLERAARDDRFIALLTEQGSGALEPYDLTPEEKAAIVSGDLRWLEEHVGRLNESQKIWINCRLQQERW